MLVLNVLFILGIVMGAYVAWKLRGWIDKGFPWSRKK